MNSIKDLITISEIMHNDSFESEKSQYNESLNYLESIGYKVLRYSVDDHREDIGKMIFEKDISPIDVFFKDGKIELTEEAMKILMSKKLVQYVQLDIPELSEFKGDIGAEVRLSYNDRTLLNLQSPVEFLVQKIDALNKNTPTLNKVSNNNI